ncbi:MAG: DUF2088 domain-containing protein, partial [candidate division Zixibacteria bacterium]|nr:DUF2088 domain-containing protein [candidate division Zixibacteria bacterium]
MEIRLAYGNAGITIDVPEWVRMDRFGLTSSDQSVTRDTLTREFTAGGGQRLIDCAAPLIVVNDGYRHTPTAEVLACIDACDRSVLDRADFLVATGTHPAPTDNHLATIFGDLLARVRDRVTWHDARDVAAMEVVGSDSFGEAVYLNRAISGHDLVYVIGSVEPHYFAGFTGGRKSLFPGLTDLATIERNHNLANSLRAAPLKLQGNPVAEHLQS